mgnify:FL=1|tara:strand:+ start:320 stop:919 length:600 start_codon:yes stop_codon:yes gene_type:complete
MDEGFPDKRVYYTPTKLPETLIESMKEYCDQLEYQDGEVFGLKENDEAFVRLDTRRSKVAWINWDEWIPGIMHSMMISANECYFKYDLRHFKDKIQSTVYSGGGEHKDFYGWHVDGGRTHIIEGVEMERKLSISLLLSDPDEYDGGELEFRYYGDNYSFVKPDAGTGVIFPSWLPHRVHPVKSGVRRSLVAWMDGPCFK